MFVLNILIVGYWRVFSWDLKVAGEGQAHLNYAARTLNCSGQKGLGRTRFLVLFLWLHICVRRCPANPFSNFPKHMASLHFSWSLCSEVWQWDQVPASRMWTQKCIVLLEEYHSRPDHTSSIFFPSALCWLGGSETVMAGRWQSSCLPGFLHITGETYQPRSHIQTVTWSRKKLPFLRVTSLLSLLTEFDLP